MIVFRLERASYRSNFVPELPGRFGVKGQRRARALCEGLGPWSVQMGGQWPGRSGIGSQANLVSISATFSQSASASISFLQATHLTLDTGQMGAQLFFFSALTLGLLLAKRWSSPNSPGLTEAYGRFLGMALGLGAAGLQ